MKFQMTKSKFQIKLKFLNVKLFANLHSSLQNPKVVALIIQAMFLGVDHLLKLVKEKNLVENLCERELTNPEGAGFDLRLGEVFTISGKGFLGIDERQTCPIKSIRKYNSNNKQTINIKPNNFYLVKTVEKVNLPEDLLAIFKPRSTLQRMGLYLRTTQVAPGYSGELTFALKNVGPTEITIELGARIVHIMFAKVSGKTNLYRGQWQGGRVTTKEKEKQV